MRSRILQDIQRRVKSLPPISRVARRLISVTNGGDVDIRELASLISKDQAMTARILRVANSSFYGLPRRVETLSKAVVILGMHTVRSIALRAAMLGMQPSGGALQTPVEALWKHSMAVASAAQLLAKRLKLPDPEVAFVAGLLHDLGKVVLMEVLSERYLRLLEHSDVATAPLHIREQSAFGITHMEAGHALCEHWNMPPLLSRVVTTHHDPVGPESDTWGNYSLMGIVRVANELAKIAKIGFGGNPYVDLEPVRYAGAGLLKGTLRDVLQGLPALVLASEASFAEVPPEKSPIPALQERPTETVAVCVESPEAEAVISLALRGQGSDVMPVEEAVADGWVPACVITDGTLPESAKAYQVQHGVPIITLMLWQCKDPVLPCTSMNVNHVFSWKNNTLSNARSAT